MIVKHGLVPESDPLDALDRWDWDEDDEHFIVFLENDDDEQENYDDWQEA